MATQQSFSQIVQSMVQRLRLTQPNLDSKVGTVARDLFIDIPANEFDRLYKSINIVSDKQSPEKAVGYDIDRWAKNYRIPRKSGGFASGIAVFTVNEITTDIPIPTGSLIDAKNGMQFKTIGSFIFSSAEKNKYAANANRLRSQLNLAGITDSFAIEVPATATRIGTAGNIAPLQLISSNVQEGLKVTNLSSFSFGINIESDNAYRARVSAIFSGANTGTDAGYKNAVLSTDGVLDALIVKPGNTLMLRDGTETIEINNGTFRILNSGTGGKVDIYLLGKNLIEINESFIFSDLSGKNDATDERNDYIVGLQGLDSALTSEERRLQAFELGKIPLQPMNTIVSLIGSDSGIFAEKITDADGIVSGNYEIVKDENVETGGSPFGYDKIHFISNVKEVVGESITKTTLNSVDTLRFSDIEELSALYQNIKIFAENSTRLLSDKSIVLLNHKPVTTVSKVSNSTTGESYTIVNQNLDASGLNTTGQMKISGRNLPSSSDILNVEYTWRQYFDPYTDYNGFQQIGRFFAPITDSIDWGTSNSIQEEACTIAKTSDNQEHTIETLYNISNVISIAIYEQEELIIKNLIDVDGDISKGITTSIAVTDIVKIRSASNVELYNTPKANGNFRVKNIYLPIDSSAQVGDTVTVSYNKTEFYDIDDSNGSFSNKTITLPSADILENAGLTDIVSDLYLTDTIVNVNYVAAIQTYIDSTAFTSLPITGTNATNDFVNASFSNIDSSSQPILFLFDSNQNAVSIAKYGPSIIAATTSGTSKPGKIKITGTTFENITLSPIVALVKDGLAVNLKSDILDYFDILEFPANMFIARVNVISSKDTGIHFDLIGYQLQNALYVSGSGETLSTLNPYEFKLPNTSKNTGYNFSTSEILHIELVIGRTLDTDILYFASDSTVYSSKIFARINSVSVVSGFRSTTGVLLGSISLAVTNQPIDGQTYFADYTFTAPKEGERISVKYTYNKLISSATSAIENVRPITADVLVKEAFELEIYVAGQIVLTDNITTSTATVIANVVDAISNLLNASALGTSVDYSNLITTAASVSGVQSINISLFNESGKTGRKTVINALDNQSLKAGTVSFTAVSRKDFSIT